jgi:hypothetical protein
MPLHLKSPERIAQMLAVLCLMILILLAGKPAFTNASVPVRGMHDPGIALQMARNVDEIDSILGPAPSADREAMRLKQYLDFALIVTYVSIAVVISVAIAAMRTMRPLAFALLLAVVAAAIFDWAGTLAILRLLPVDLNATTQPMIDAIRRASTAKWSLTGLALALLSVFFFRSRRWYLRILAGWDLVAGALAGFGVFHNEWLPWAAGMLSAGLVLSAATLKLLTHESAS